MTAPGRDAVAALLGAFEAGRAALAAGITVAPLAGGPSNRTLRVTSVAGDWAVRIAGPDDGAFGINRVAERQVHAAAAAAGFAPAIVHAVPTQGVLITEFVTGQTPTRDELRSDAWLDRLGRHLAQLHALPPPRGVRRLDLHDVLAHYLERRDAPEGPVPRAELAARLRWSLASYRPAASALCHNDVHWRNVIAAGDRLCLVDWEYGGVGDPLFDLAAIVGYHDLDVAQRARLLAAYGRDFRPADVDHLCRVFDCLHALWLDAAGGWQGLEPDRREALLARLAVDPAVRGA